MSTLSNEKAFTGGCHCGHLRYTVDLDLSKPTASKCNCSICLKINRLSIKIQPEKFKLVSPASRIDIGDYEFGGSYPLNGKEVHHMTINAVTLDPDQGVDLRKFQVLYVDGKGENWAEGFKDVPSEGGVY